MIEEKDHQDDDLITKNESSSLFLPFFHFSLVFVADRRPSSSSMSSDVSVPMSGRYSVSLSAVLLLADHRRLVRLLLLLTVIESIRVSESDASPLLIQRRGSEDVSLSSASNNNSQKNEQMINSRNNDSGTDFSPSADVSESGGEKTAASSSPFLPLILTDPQHRVFRPPVSPSPSSHPLMKSN